MPVDPAGTEPGLSPDATPAKKIVLIRCRRPVGDQPLGCDGMEAEVLVAGPRTQFYVCTKCGYRWGAPILGGALEF